MAKEARRLDLRESMPQSLADMLREIRERIFDLKVGEMAAALNRVRREPAKTPVFNREKPGKLERREHGAYFEHLECYSRLLGIPTCTLSFASRYQREPLDEAVKVAEAMLKVAREAQASGQKRFTIKDLHKMAVLTDLDIPGRPKMPPLSLDDVVTPVSAAKSREDRQLGDPGMAGPLFGSLGKSDDD